MNTEFENKTSEFSENFMQTQVLKSEVFPWTFLSFFSAIKAKKEYTEESFPLLPKRTKGLLVNHRAEHDIILIN